MIVPTFQESASILTILARLRSAVPDADVLVVDDNSPDGTAQMVALLARTDPRLAVLVRPDKSGLGRAYLSGFRYALDHGYDYIVEIDADGSHDPAELPRMLQLAAGGRDLVIGSRWVPGGSVSNWSRSRQAISRAGNRYSRFMLGSTVRDITAGFRVFRADTVRLLLQQPTSSQGYCFQIEMAWHTERAGLSIAEHPITFEERSEGVSKMHLGIVAEALWRVTVWGVQKRLSPGQMARRSEG
ncbi:polyprenol monophosphomannose synthase [Microterricola viridarii]|uniref:Dolichol-phosphate mannosyltransferase n=1 Tax=Microterricola viridarii TaxID=412690 RepID=A0A0X8E1A7_9MICO|nr:polyprenol monophosphomannose synthase [Microterricola viridarii]AMB58509.1 dolichol-phosphate mannosyltransferase [Microterricola viridarii]